MDFPLDGRENALLCAILHIQEFQSWVPVLPTNYCMSWQLSILPWTPVNLRCSLDLSMAELCPYGIFGNVWECMRSSE